MQGSVAALGQPGAFALPSAEKLFGVEGYWDTMGYLVPPRRDDEAEVTCVSL